MTQTRIDVVLWGDRRGFFATLDQVLEKQRTYRALPVSAVFASFVRHRVEVNEVIMRSHCQQGSICGRKGRGGGERDRDRTRYTREEE